MPNHKQIFAQKYLKNLEKIKGYFFQVKIGILSCQSTYLIRKFFEKKVSGYMSDNGLYGKKVSDNIPDNGLCGKKASDNIPDNGL